MCSTVTLPYLFAYVSAERVCYICAAPVLAGFEDFRKSDMIQLRDAIKFFFEFNLLETQSLQFTFSKPTPIFRIQIT